MTLLQKTIQIKLVPTNSQEKLLDGTLLEYIRTVNHIVEVMNTEEKREIITTSTINSQLPSALKNQCIRDASSVVKKHKKGITKTLAILKKPVAIWNNQNFTFTENSLSFPVWINKSIKISVKALITPQQLNCLNLYKKGTLRITKKNHKYVAQISIAVPEVETATTGIMGVDLGIKVPAVCRTQDNKTLFVGNGRENKYTRRLFKEKRRKLGKNKKPKAIRTLNNKEQRIMQDLDHKYSRSIVDFAVENNIGTIRLEQLAGIRKSTRKSRKNNHSLHNWSFYRLANYISYKAAMVGISVEFVDPAYTSQTCPNCGKRNKTKDRQYNCFCGYHNHRDLVGAINIMSKIHGHSESA